MTAEQFIKQIFGDLAEMRVQCSDPENREKFLERLFDRGVEKSGVSDLFSVNQNSSEYGMILNDANKNLGK